jgi:hypothetical protein
VAGTSSSADILALIGKATNHYYNAMLHKVTRGLDLLYVKWLGRSSQVLLAMTHSAIHPVSTSDGGTYYFRDQDAIMLP